MDSETVPDPVQSPSIQCLAISLMATFLRSEFVYLMGPGSGCLGQQADSFRDQSARLRWCTKVSVRCRSARAQMGSVTGLYENKPRVAAVLPLLGPDAVDP